MPAATSLSEAPTMPTPIPPFRPHRIRLVGHRDLGTVLARYVGCWLEIDHPEHGGRYGPSAVFRAEPVPEAVPETKASRGALVWVKLPGIDSWHYLQADRNERPTYGASHNQCIKWTPSGYGIVYDIPSPDLPAAIAQIITWAREDGYEVPPWPGEPAVPVEPQPEPVPALVGTWGGHTDWIAWGGGECPVPAETMVQIVTRDEAAGRYPWEDKAGKARSWYWSHKATHDYIIAYRIVQPAPKDRTVYDPDDVQRGDRHVLSDGTRGTVLGVIDGWIAYTDRVSKVQHGVGIVRVDPVEKCEDDDIPF